MRETLASPTAFTIPSRTDLLGLPYTSILRMAQYFMTSVMLGSDTCQWRRTASES